ncbi:hypothetical protein [Malikia sp.]|uniref:hypothetical protein n=1 Tax=Malikia sp. TaxID=2070706 RepID=UPI00261BC148|nr:hypothetical protein [Malikia sp.]MDD2728764.1 hypothetical protein [Malikia sp.]
MSVEIALTVVVLAAGFPWLRRRLQRALLAWWDEINACQETGAHHLDGMVLGVWTVSWLHYSVWPDCARRR